MTMTMMMMISQACDSRFGCDRGCEDEEKSLPRASARRRQTTHSYPPHTRAYYIRVRVYPLTQSAAVGAAKAFIKIVPICIYTSYYIRTRERALYTIIIYCHRTITALQTNQLCIYLLRCIYIYIYIRCTPYIILVYMLVRTLHRCGARRRRECCVNNARARRASAGTVWVCRAGGREVRLRFLVVVRRRRHFCWLLITAGITF